MNRKFSLTAALALAWLTVSALPDAANAGQKGRNGLTVVELYTSQGCSSCPPADRLLGRLAKQSGILALSFHVDYWDYIGWKDPYGSPSNSRRQRDYKRTFNRFYVYTPQMVVGGMFEVTGFDAAAVLAGIKQASLAPNVPIDLSRDGAGDLRILISASPNPIRTAVWLALFDMENKTRVRRGENSGRTIVNYNVVRDFKKSAIGTAPPRR